MDSFEALMSMPERAVGFLTCVVCLKVQGWITSLMGTVIKAEDFIPAPLYPSEAPQSGNPMTCAWCGVGPCMPHAPYESLGSSTWKVALQPVH